MNGRVKPGQRVRDAVSELKATIVARYPSARFEIVRAVDDPKSYDLLVTVASADPDDVLDLVVNRVVEMRVEQSIPLHVLALQPDDGLPVARSAQRRQAGRARWPGSTRGQARDVR
jgi:hypothetical protein